jgi:hypothetical protein
LGQRRVQLRLGFGLWFAGRRAKLHSVTMHSLYACPSAFPVGWIWLCSFFMDGNSSLRRVVANRNCQYWTANQGRDSPHVVGMSTTMIGLDESNRRRPFLASFPKMGGGGGARRGTTPVKYLTYSRVYRLQATIMAFPDSAAVLNRPRKSNQAVLSCGSHIANITSSSMPKTLPRFDEIFTIPWNDLCRRGFATWRHI